MPTFKPKVSYKWFKEGSILCRHCKAPLNCDNFGEKITEEEGYQLPNTMYLTRWGFFCNTCSPMVAEAMIELEEEE